MEAGFSTYLSANEIIDGKYRLLSCIGIGGMTEIWKAEILDPIRQEIQGKPYTALSFINSKFSSHSKSKQIFEHQFHIACLMKHPNIVKFYEYALDEGRQIPFIVMELLEGKTLFQAMQDNSLRRYKKVNVFSLIKKIANAISFIHKNGYVHSDIKLDNIFLLNDGNIKLYDFSISRKQQGFVSKDIKLEEFDAIEIGAMTRSYASIEMLQGQPADVRDDIYSFAIVVYLMLTGKHPFHRMNAEEAKKDKLKPEAISYLNKKQNLAIEKALAFDKEKRFKTINEFWQELKFKRFLFF